MGFRSSGTERFSYIRGLICLLFSGLSPGLVFVCLSVEYSRYSLPWQSVLRTTSPQLRSLCSFPPLIPECKQLLNHSVLMSAWGERIPMTPFLKSRSISSRSRLAASRGLFPLPSLFSCFCFDFNASHVLANGWPVIIESLRPCFFRWRSTEAINPLRVVGSYSSPDFFRTDSKTCSARYPIRPMADLKVFDTLSPSRGTPKLKSSPLRFFFLFFLFGFSNVKKIFYVCICMQNESSSHSSSKFQKQTTFGLKKTSNSLNKCSATLCRSLIKLTEWRQRRVTCQQLIGYINTCEKIRYFFTSVVTTFLSAGNLCITPQFIW